MPGGVVLQGDASRAEILRRERRGELVRVARGVYVEAGADPEAAVRRDWARVVAHLYPGAVVTDRSVTRVAPDDDGRIYVAVDHRPWSKPSLPGLTVEARHGLGPRPDDIPLPHGLYLASTGRALAENLLPRRARPGQRRRALTDAELGDWLDRSCRTPEAAAAAGREAAAVAAAYDAPAAAARAADLLDGAAGARPVDSGSRALAGRSRGRPVDTRTVAAVEACAAALAAGGRRLPSHPLDGNPITRGFYESFFSNFIEGTEWTVDAARRIVFDPGGGDGGRPADAHDIRSVYLLATDRRWAAAVPASAEEFTQLLLDRHAVMMAGRPETGPGRFKAAPNRVGSRWFTDPDAVDGTLRAAWDIVASADNPFARAVLVHYTITAVHPFADGNGRSARLAANAALEDAGLQRIVVPTVWRDDYLSGLRAFDRHGDPDPMIRSLAAAADWSASVDWGDDPTAVERAVGDAFLLPDEAGPRRLPTPPPHSAAPAPPPPRQFTRCPHITAAGRRCRNWRWTGARCVQHRWTAP